MLANMHGNIGPEDDPNFVERQVLEAKLQKLLDKYDQISRFALLFGDIVDRDCVSLSLAALECVEKLKVGVPFFHEQFDRYLASQSSCYLQLSSIYLVAKDYPNAIKYLRLGYDGGMILCAKSNYYLVTLMPCVIQLGKYYLQDGLEFEDAVYWARMGRYCCELYFEMKYEEPSCHSIKEDKVVDWCVCSGGHEYVRRFHAKDPESEARRLRYMMECYLTYSYENFFEYYMKIEEYRLATEFGCLFLSRYRSIHPDEMDQNTWIEEAIKVIAASIRAGAFKQVHHLLGTISMLKCRGTEKKKVRKFWVEFGALLVVEAIQKFCEENDLPDTNYLFDRKVERWEHFQTVMEGNIQQKHFLLDFEPLESHEKVVEHIAKVRSWNFSDFSGNFENVATIYESLYKTVMEGKAN